VSIHWTSSTATSTGSYRLRTRICVEQRDRNSARVGHAALRLCQEERDLKGVSLRRGQLGEHVGDGLARQVADRRE
jgi:hypothetical protein